MQEYIPGKIEGKIKLARYTLNGSSCASSLKKELLLGQVPVIYGTKE